MFLNFFIPSVKQISKVRVGSKVIKKYDEAKTPYQRVKESKFIKKEIKQTLKEIKSNLNPFRLENSIQRQIKEIHDSLF